MYLLEYCRELRYIATIMKRSDIHPLPEYFDRYINLVPDVELVKAFDDSLRQIDSLDRPTLTSLAGKRYAADKWTVNDTIQHLIDTERIMSYRTLLYARRDGTVPAGFDQDYLVAHAGADRRPIGKLLDELTALRRATKSMFESFDDETLRCRGICWKYEISVLAMGFSTIGHQFHHLKIVEEKYYPLLRS